MLFSLSSYTDVSLLLLRILIAIVFIDGGINDIRQPVARGKSIEMSPLFTAGLGIWETTAAISILLGIFAQIGASMLILIMCGAIYKEIIVWHKKFFEGNYGGWHYDTIFLIVNLVILTTGGGKFILLS